jgi:broad specificity phosphatase PhoE
MSVRLTLICHAATAATREAAFPADEPLDAQGQAAAAARAPGLRRVDAAWTSPAPRARQTATALGLAATVDDRLRDMDMGRWAGRLLADVERAEPSAMALWTGDAAAAPHGGESVVDVIARVGGWLDAMGHATGKVVAVTHPAIVRACVVVALGARPGAFWRIDIAPLGGAEFQGRAGAWTLRSLSQA